MSDWQDWIGKTTTVEEQLDADRANHMAVTLDRDPGFQAGDTLPPAWHWLYFHDLVKATDLGSEGHPKLGILMPPVMLPRRMWAGGSFTFHSPLRLGATVRKTSIIRSIEPKHGRSGPLCFVTLEHSLSTGKTINLLETQTIVYREMSNEAGMRKSAEAPLEAEITKRYTLDSTALFRYSALTFNGHRIHYDADYCRDVEGYPNLVIHGPLIATLLLDLYIRMGKPLHAFSYRAKNPLFLPNSFSVNARSDGDSTRLWASDHEGGLAMAAEAAAG